MQKTITLAVAGMTCGSCAGRVRAALEAVEGVDTVQVTLEPGRAAVAGAEDIDTDRLISAVRAAGYRAGTGSPEGLPVVEANASCCARKD